MRGADGVTPTGRQKGVVRQRKCDATLRSRRPHACIETPFRIDTPGVSAAAFCAQPPDLRFAPLMDMDFAISCPLVRHWRLISGSCPSTRTLDPCFLQTPPRGGSPCIVTSPSPPSGWAEDFHLQAAEHAQHTTKPYGRRFAWYVRRGYSKRFQLHAACA